jgi:hypothetical protein
MCTPSGAGGRGSFVFVVGSGASGLSALLMRRAYHGVGAGFGRLSKYSAKTTAAAMSRSERRSFMGNVL